MKKIAILCMLAISLLTSCRSKKAPEKPETKDNVYVQIGESQYRAIHNLIQREGKNDWSPGTSFLTDGPLWEYRFTDEANKQHAVQIQDESVILSAIAYNLDPRKVLVYTITKDDVWILEMPDKLLNEKEAVEIVKKDYSALLAKAEK
jgi:hypothetical protein